MNVDLSVEGNLQEDAPLLKNKIKTTETTDSSLDVMS